MLQLKRASRRLFVLRAPAVAKRTEDVSTHGLAPIRADLPRKL